MNDTAHGYLRQTITALVALSLVLTVFGPVGMVAADPSVSVEQTADSTTVAPGDTVTITTTLTAQDVNGPLVELEFPDGWEGTVIDSDGGAVRPQDTSGNVLPSNSPSVVWFSAGTYEVTTELQVPEDAASGDYTISTTGSGVDPTDDDDGVANEDDEIASTETIVTVQEPDPNEGPTASFTATPSAPDAGETVSFDASASSDGDGTIESYEWDFGDGATATGASASNTYDAAGDYDVTLTVTDDDGATAQATQTVSVSEVPNQDPTASISGPSSAQVDEQVSFDASASSDGDGTIESYEWDFGDGATATGASVTHAFDAAGDYDIELTVTDDDGAAATATQTVSVSEAPDPASFQVSNLSVESPVTQGDASTVTATVENAGDESGTQTVTLDVDGIEVDSESITLDGAASQQVSFTVDTAGLTVGDHDVTVSSDDDSASATLDVTAPEPANQPPTADAGDDQTVSEGDSVALDASGSTDADGDDLAYDWTQTGGTDVTLSDAGTATPSFTAPDVDADETLTFEVEVSDGEATDTDAVTVTVEDTDEAEPPTDGPSTEVTLSPESDLVAVGDSAEYDIVVSDADGGVGVYSMTVTVDDPSVASITDANLSGVSDGGLTDVQIAADGSSATIEAVLINTNDTGAVTLGTVTVESAAEGATALSLDVSELGDESGNAYTVTATSGATLEASTLVVGNSENPAQDPDGDGVYEDVNGDGSVDVLDVQLLFNERNGQVVQNSPEAFDFNGDGTFSLLDIQTLFATETG